MKLACASTATVPPIAHGAMNCSTTPSGVMISLPDVTSPASTRPWPIATSRSARASSPVSVSSSGSVELSPPQEAAASAIPRIAPAGMRRIGTYSPLVHFWTGSVISRIGPGRSQDSTAGAWQDDSSFPARSSRDSATYRP